MTAEDSCLYLGDIVVSVRDFVVVVDVVVVVVVVVVDDDVGGDDVALEGRMVWVSNKICQVVLITVELID